MKKFQKLSRAEMKNVMGGQPDPPPSCTVGSGCNWFGIRFGSEVSGPGHCDASCNCDSDAGYGASIAGPCTNTGE